MKIALVYDGVYPYSVGGGEKVFHDLAHFLSHRHEVHLLSMKLWEGEAVREVAPNVFLHGLCEPTVKGTLQGSYSRSVRQAIKFSFKVHKALMKIGDLDLIDCMATPYFPLYASAFAARRLHVPLVSTWLEMWGHEHWVDYLGPGIKARIGERIEYYATDLPDHIISISPHTTEGLEESGVAVARLDTIPPWIDVDAIVDTQADNEASDILFVGRLIESKGVARLVDAMSLLVQRIPDVQCRIVGDGPERDSLEKQVHELSLENNVRFSGFLDEHANVLSAMKSSKVFVLPSTREGFGIVVVEAGACGLPSVVVDAPNNASKDLVRESTVGTVCADESGAMADALEAQLNSDLRASAAMLADWVQDYDWRRRAVHYEQVYNRVRGTFDVLG